MPACSTCPLVEPVAILDSLYGEGAVHLHSGASLLGMVRGKDEWVGGDRVS